MSQKRKGSGPIIALIVVLAFVGGLGFGVQKIIKNPEKYNSGSKSSVIEKSVGTTEEGAIEIKKVLSDCGIEGVKAIEHDELLDNLHFEGEKGYRIEAKQAGNIILYLNANDTVYMVNYIDNELYSNNQVNFSIIEFVVDIDEATEWQIRSQDAIKMTLKDSDSAKFPNIKKWAFGKRDGTMVVQSYVEAKNDLGLETKHEFQLIYNMDTSDLTSLMLDGVEYLQ